MTEITQPILNPQLSGTEFAVLSTMRSWRDGFDRYDFFTPVGIASKLEISVQTAMTGLDGLVVLGYVTRDLSPAFGFIYSLTRKGIAP